MNNENNSKKLLDFKSGGWIIVAAMVLSLTYFSIFIINAINNQETRIGDGRNLETYQFNLSNPLIPTSQITPAGMSKDGLESLTDSELIKPQDVEMINEEERGKYLVGNDIIVGLNINGEVRAYPLRVLNWHEIINDTLGDMPISVTYNPLSGSVVCFKRNVNDQIFEFGISGLLFNSHHLIYNRNPQLDQESLWMPLMQKAVAGPLSGTEFTLISCTLSLWSEWIDHHPNTTVIKPQYEYKKRYKRAPYSKYFEDKSLRFPVEPLPNESIQPYKTRMVVIVGEEQEYPFTYDEVSKNVVNNVWEKTIEGETVEFVYNEQPEVVKVKLIKNSKLTNYYSYWFAWYSIKNI